MSERDGNTYFLTRLLLFIGAIALVLTALGHEMQQREIRDLQRRVAVLEGKQ